MPNPLTLRISLIVLSLTALADPFSGSFDVGTSVSHSYDARNVLVNPAALGYEQDLNGSAFFSSYALGRTHDSREQLSFTLGYGPLGVGWEKLTDTTGEFSRLSISGGFGLSHQLYLGTRYSFTNSGISALDSIHSLDLGLQYRALPWLSLGFALNRMNHPEVGGVKSPSQYVVGVTLNPFDPLFLSFDVSTTSDAFGSPLSYQGTGAYEVLEGLELVGGYHKEWETHVGIRLVLGRAKIHTEYQPSRFQGGHNSQGVFGIQTSILPRKSFLAPATALQIEIGDNLSEVPSGGGLFSKGQPTLLALLTALNKAASDPKLKLVVIRLESFPLGLAAAHEVQEALLKIRNAGKSVEVFIGEAGMAEYLIASGANRISMNPSGSLRLLGARSERFYVKGTLDKIGVEGQFLARGEFKSAPETFTRKEASPESRGAALHEIKNLEIELVKAISKGRKFLAEDYKKITKAALFGAELALESKLIDAIEDSQSGLDRIEKSHSVRNSMLWQRDTLSLPDRVSVIIASGNILNTKHRLLSLSGQEQITPETMSDQLRDAVSDPRTKAIVVRINSGGGEVLASHKIATAISKAKEKKPVYISMGDAAASGGYMMAAPATKIFADPFTMTGSIGVFLGKFSLAKLYQKLDLNKEIISNSPYPGLFSESRSWNENEYAIMQRQLDQYYKNFVHYVAVNRKISDSDAESAAKGRVWLGAEAGKLHLIDKEGGLMETIQEAAKHTGRDVDKMEVAVLRPYEGLFPMLTMGVSTPKLSITDELLFSLLDKKYVKDFALVSGLPSKPFLYWDPYVFRHY